MWLPRALLPILGLALVAGCTDAPPLAPERPLGGAAQLATTTVVDGFTITVLPKPPGWGFMEPIRILDDGTVYGIADADEPGLIRFRWTAANGTERVAEIPPRLAGRDVETPDGQFFYDDGTARSVAGRHCGHSGPPDPSFDDPDFCDYSEGLGTYVTSSCFPDGPEPGVHGVGLAVNARCHVLAARRTHGPSREWAVYLWRPESGWLRIIENPIPIAEFDLWPRVPLLNNEGQAEVAARGEGGTRVTSVWRADLGSRVLPLPRAETGVPVSSWVTAMNDRGQMAGFAEGYEGGEQPFVSALVWTPPPVDRASYPTVNASPVATAVRTTYLGRRKGFYTQYYKLAAPDGAGPWAVRVEWGDGTARTDTRSRAGVIDAAIHNYTRTGTYTVRVTVVDRRGRSGSDTRTITVRP